MKKILPLVALSCLALPSLATDQATAMDLARKNGCLSCHALDKKVVGPGWNEVGRKYAGDPAAVEQLVIKVKKGTKGTWGAVPMPPNATVKDADIRMLVDFVLTLQ